MITLTTALSLLHVSQQAIHFGNRQLTIGTHGSVASHSRKNFIDMMPDALRGTMFDQVRNNISQ